MRVPREGDASEFCEGWSGVVCLSLLLVTRWQISGNCHAVLGAFLLLALRWEYCKLLQASVLGRFLGLSGWLVSTHPYAHMNPIHFANCINVLSGASFVDLCLWVVVGWYGVYMYSEIWSPCLCVLKMETSRVTQSEVQSESHAFTRGVTVSRTQQFYKLPVMS